MQELNEYTAEVMRRAEGMKRARKNSLVKTVSLCAPLVLITFAAALILPKLLPNGAVMPDSDEALPETIEASAVVSAALIQQDAITDSVEAPDSPVDEMIQEGGAVMTDADSIDALLALIEEIEREGLPSHESGYVIASHEESAIITLTRSDGSTVSYTLSRERLTNAETGESFEITAEQYARFMELFE